MTISQFFAPAVVDAPSPDYSQVVGAFEEIALLTTSDSASLDDVLRLVGQRLCELMGVSRCSVYLRRDDGRFQGQVGYCVGKPNLDAGVSRLVAGVDDDRFTAEIVATGSPVIVHDATHDSRTIRRTMRRWGVHAMVGVPLVVDHEVIGIIYVDNQDQHHDYTDRDIRLAQAFAGLSALAVRQGWLYKQLGERARIIDRQRRVLGETSTVHNTVTRAVLDGADIEAILQLIVDQLGKPVVLYSSRLDVVAWAAPDGVDLASSPGMSQQLINQQWVQRAIAELDGVSSTVMLRATPESRCRRLLARMVVDGQCVGYLELCELGRPFSPVDAKALEQASMAVALKLLTVQRKKELTRQEREQYFSDILYGRKDLGPLERRAASFGIDPELRHAILRLHYAETVDGNDGTGERRRSQVQALLVNSLGQRGRPVASTSVPGADLVLIEAPVTETGASDGPLSVGLRSAFDALVDRFDVRFAVVSDPTPSLSDLPVVADKVREIANLVRDHTGTPRLVFARELDLLRLIASREGIDGAMRHAEELLRPLVDHDAAGGGSLVQTLCTFVELQGQIRATAAALSVHENTVRYRLNRIREVSCIEPERLDSLLNVSLALQVRLLFGTAAPPATIGPNVA